MPEDVQSLMRAATCTVRCRAVHVGAGMSPHFELARTIADLAGCAEIQSVHLAEALHASPPAEVDDGAVESSWCLGYK